MLPAAQRLTAHLGKTTHFNSLNLSSLRSLMVSKAFFIVCFLLECPEKKIALKLMPEKKQLTSVHNFLIS